MPSSTQIKRSQYPTGAAGADPKANAEWSYSKT